LQQALCAPIAASLSRPAAGLQIFAAPDCLSQESAAGFQSALEAYPPRNVIVLCGVAPVSDLYRYALNGGWILWEAPFGSNPFGIALQPPIAASADHLYIRYHWPQPILTRSFSTITPVHCQQSEAIAHYRGVPVALKRRVGPGGIIVFGSMLGPNLRADEPQARQLLTLLVAAV
jgi:hypothetical protein